MKISPDEVARVAALARLRLTQAKLEVFAGQLDDILSYMETLNQVDTSKTEPLYTPVEHTSRMREDVVKAEYSREDILSNAPEDNGAFFIVPKII